MGRTGLPLAKRNSLMFKFSIRHLMLLTFIVAVAIWGVSTFEVRADLEGFESLVVHGTQIDYVYCNKDGAWQWLSYPAETFDHLYSEDELREPGQKILEEHPEWLQARAKS